MNAPTRPACFEFAMSFLGDPEETELRETETRLVDLNERIKLSQQEQAGASDEQLIHAYQEAYAPAWNRGEHYGCHVDGLRAVLRLCGDQVRQALIKAECALADIAEGEPEGSQDSADLLQWAERRAASALEQIRPVMVEFGVPTSEWPPNG